MDQIHTSIYSNCFPRLIALLMVLIERCYVMRHIQSCFSNRMLYGAGRFPWICNCWRWYSILFVWLY